MTGRRLGFGRADAPSASLSRVFIRGFNAPDQSELRDGMVSSSFTFPPVEMSSGSKYSEACRVFCMAFPPRRHDQLHHKKPARTSMRT